MSEDNIGGTFIDWSLFYFSDSTKFYNPLTDKIHAVVDDPLNKNNAHNHCKIHPNSVAELKFCIDQLNSFSEFYSIYAYNDILPNQSFSWIEYLRDSQQDTSDLVNFYHSKIKLEEKNFQQYLLGNNIKTLILRENKEDCLYGLFNNGRAYGSTPEDEMIKFYNKFFSKNIDKWEDSNIWNIKENIALSIRPFNNQTNLDINLPSELLYELTFSDIIDNLDILIEDILRFAGIKLLPNKFETWKEIYHKWQKIHDVNFYRNWQLIIDKIVSGEDFDLSDFKMDLLKDIFIQHVLIYKYNLNIKNYGVTSLPLNTKLIHALLEENIHQVDCNYREFIKNV